jgi:biotin carboxyl carrier protein
MEKMMKTYKLKLNNKIYEVDIELVNESADMSISDTSQSTSTPAPSASPAATTTASEGGQEVTAPLPGKILDICVKEGQNVKKGDLLVIVEAMKLENEVFSDFEGIIRAIKVNKGDNVNTNDALIAIG